MRGVLASLCDARITCKACLASDATLALLAMHGLCIALRCKSGFVGHRRGFATLKTGLCICEALQKACLMQLEIALIPVVANAFLLKVKAVQ